MYLIQNALLLDPQNVSLLVVVFAGCAWVLMLMILLADVITDEKLKLGWKFLWIPLLLALPVISGLFFSVFSLVRSIFSSAKK